MIENTCLLFAGQGSQYTGMGGELLELCPTGGRIFEAGSDILGFDVKNACLNWDAERLAQTEVSQPVILAVSLLAFEAVKSLDILPAFVAGHSLGEYAAMAAAGMLSLEDVFRVIKARAHAMGECAKQNPGSMAAVMAPPEEIEAVCAEVEGYVIPVNYNSPAQTVVAGETAAVERVMELFAIQGKRCVKLAVSAAFHTKLMQPAADEFRAAIASIPFSAPRCAFYSNTTGEELTDFTESDPAFMPDYLAKHLVSPVRFTAELAALQAAGAERFIECGPNKVLTGLVKKTLEDISAYNVENAKTFEKLKANL